MSTRPAILILTGMSPAVRRIAEPVLWGIEEEGIPYEIRAPLQGSATASAKEAANGSPLNVGVAVGDGGEIVLHHRDLPREAPLFSFPGGVLGARGLRRLGINAARLVKGQPLVPVTGEEEPPGSFPNGVEDLASRILDAVLRAHASPGK